MAITTIPEVREEIQENIKTNSQREITGQVLQDTLIDMLDTVDEAKANTTGYYEGMSVGLADNLISPDTTSDTASWIYRSTAGNQDVSSGFATIEGMKGNTIVWNQLINASNFENQTVSGLTITNNGDGSITINGTSDGHSGFVYFGANSYMSAILGHRYMFYIKTNSSDNFINKLGVDVISTTNLGSYSKGLTPYISECTFAFTLRPPRLRVNNVVFTASNLRVWLGIIDLTQMFGAGNEPSTVAQVEEWLAQNVGYKEYYAYDAGSLLSFNPTDLQTVGFNQYDNSKQTGNVHVLADNKYRIKGTYSSLTYSDGSNVTVTDGYFTPDRVDYLTLSGGNNVDTCVHLSWSGYRDGSEDYERYWKSDTDLSWISNIQYNGSPLFPNGLCKAGEVYDEISGGKAIKRIGSVDMGGLTWNYNASYGFSSATIATKIKSPSTNAIVANILCINRISASHDVVYSAGTTSNRIAVTNNGLISTNSQLTDPTEFKTAMNGVMLYYELATPIVVDLPSGLNLNYRMDDFGTEELINTDVASNVPGLCAPMEIHIEYQDNLRDKIRRLDDNYVSLNPQENSESKKLQARENIGAAATSGSYPELLAGNLVGQTVDRDTYLIRPTGNGGEDVASGTASVIGMEGNSYVWNQMVPISAIDTSKTENGVTITDNRDGSYTISTDINGATATTYNRVLDLMNPTGLGGHKILIKGISGGSVSTYSFQDAYSGHFVAYDDKIINIANNGRLSYAIKVSNGAIITSPVTVKPQLIDLTLLGINNLTTTAQVEAWLAQNVGTKPYYAYNAGTILSSKTLGMKTYGQNLFNPETKKATLIPYSWEVNSNIYTIKNVPSGATATFTPDNTSGAETVDVSGGSLDITSYGSGVLELSDATASTYVCMKWDGAKDDDVVPYEEYTYGFDVTKVYGKVNGEGEYVQCFPQGMKSTGGSTHDTLVASKAVSKIGSVDLGSLTWYMEGVRFYSLSLNGLATGSGSICQKYVKASASDVYNGIDKVMYTGKSGYFDPNQYTVVINDSSYNTATSFKTAMSGVILNYYLATPITYTNLIYSEDEGATGTPLSDVLLNINANNWSMEEQLLPAYVDGNPTSVPATVSTIYGLNAVEAIDKLQKTTYTESEIHSNLASLLSCINTNCSTVLGGTFSVSDTATEKVFSFTFTPNE